MGTGYTRNDTGNNIADGNVINASDLDGEFDAVEAAFNASTGHTHDGTSAEGAPIEVAGPAQDLVITATEVRPKTDNTLDLGTGSFEFKDLYLDGTANIDSLVADTADINGGTIDGATLGTNSAVTEAQIDNININGNTITSTDTNGDITISPDGTGTVVIDTDLDVDNININGNTISSTDTNGNIAITPDGTGEVDISKVDIDGGAIDGTTIGGSSAAAGSFTTLNTSGAVVFNDAGADVDFRVEGNTDANLLFVDAGNDRVGIGTSSPSQKLEVNGSILTPNTVYANTVAGENDTNTFIRFEGSDVMAFRTGNTERMRIDSSGNVGIGTSSPNAPLVIDSSQSNNNAQLKNSASNGYGLYSKGGGGGSGYYVARFDAYDGTERMRIDSSGNVGIGTSSPAQLLQVNGSSPFINIRDGANSNPRGIEFDYGGSLISGSLINFGGTGETALSGGESGTSGYFLTFKTNGTERMRIDASGRVGIGTSSPASALDVRETATSAVPLRLDTNGGAADDVRPQISMFSGGSNGYHISTIRSNVSNDPYGLAFIENTTERMRLDSSGNLLVSKTSAGTTTAGVEARADGLLAATKSGAKALNLNRLTDDGDIAVFQKDGTKVGSIGNDSNNLYIVFSNANDVGLAGGYSSGSPVIFPVGNTGAVKDNVIDLGYSSGRFDDIYATNGTIQTSDRNQKQDIEELSEAEQRVAVAAKSLMRKFRWKSAVEKKGDDARIHFGIIAQDLQAAFEAEGLDAGRYAMFISSTWWETQTEVPAVEAKDAVLDEEGNVIEEAVEAKEAYTRTDTYDTAEEAPEGAVERTRLGVRYPELLAFIIAAI